MKEEKKPEYPEKTFRKRHILKTEDSSPYARLKPAQ